MSPSLNYNELCDKTENRSVILFYLYLPWINSVNLFGFMSISVSERCVWTENLEEKRIGYKSQCLILHVPAPTFLKYNCISQVGRGTLLIICQSLFILLAYHLLVDWINQPNLSEKNLSLFLRFKLTFRLLWNIQ